MADDTRAAATPDEEGTPNFRDLMAQQTTPAPSVTTAASTPPVDCEHPYVVMGECQDCGAVATPADCQHPYVVMDECQDCGATR